MIAAAGTAAAIKLSQQDAQRIEEHTGLPPQDLEDADLNQAIQELNITPQPLSAEDADSGLRRERTQLLTPGLALDDQQIPLEAESSRADDVLALMTEVRALVEASSGFRLRSEIKLVGFDDGDVF